MSASPAPEPTTLSVGVARRSGLRRIGPAVAVVPLIVLSSSVVLLVVVAALRGHLLPG